LEGEADGPLVQLCACRGSSKWSHKACVDDWRRKSDTEDAAYRCGVCKDYYRDALSLELLSARLQAERTDGGNLSFTLERFALELQAQGKYDEAEPRLRKALEVRRVTLGNWHQSTLACINNLGTLLQDKGDLASAEPLLREALEGSRETLGNRHPDTLCSINNLGQLLRAKGDLASAELLFREALEVQRETLGSRHSNTLASVNNLGTLLQDKGDLASAELLFREVLEGRRATLGSWNWNLDTLISIDNLCMLLIHRRLELTYKYIASSCRSPSLVRMTAVSCAAVCSAIVCMYLMR